jgi:6-aminohexanoate-oligomer endohydrolase
LARAVRAPSPQLSHLKQNNKRAGNTWRIQLRTHSRFLALTCSAICLLGAATQSAGAARGDEAMRPGTGSASDFSFDFPGVAVGVGEYDDGPTGATVILFSKPVVAAVDVRGGSPGTINTDKLRLGYDNPFVNAITISGGSSYGLAFATGVASALKDATPGANDWQHRVTVVGAVVWDLGTRRYNATTPDETLARRAVHDARPGIFPLGARGAGRMTWQGGFFDDYQHSGEGAALRQSGVTKVLVFTVVNAYGSVVDRLGHVVRCSRPELGDCGTIAERMSAHLSGLGPAQVAALGDSEDPGSTHNTTITVVITNQKLPFWSLQRLAVQVHNSMARAIQPFGTASDGDTLFAATTGEVDKSTLGSEDLGVLASETAWDAVLASVPALPAPGPRTPITVAGPMLDSYAGVYEFAPGVTGVVRRTGAGLEITVAGHDSLYLPEKRAVRLTAVATDEFILATGRADRLRFERDSRGRVAGLTIEPGPWPVRAKRVVSTAK